MAARRLRACHVTGPGEVVVAGIVLRAGPSDSRAGAIEGPALCAAAGVVLAGLAPMLLAAVPAMLGPIDRLVLERLSVGGDLTLSRAQPALRYEGPPVVGDGAYAIHGDPPDWRATCPTHRLGGRSLVLANGDPEWYALLLADACPAFTAMDLHRAWLHVRLREIATCLRRVDLVTLTESELDRLPRDAVRGLRYGQPGGPAMVVKRGSRGVTLLAAGASRDASAPTPEGGVQSDVGAGDFLLGALTARLAQAPPPVSMARLQAAYRSACRDLGRFLAAPSLTAFLSQENLIALPS